VKLNPKARICHQCLYDLRGHASPARCPECGIIEVSCIERLATWTRSVSSIRLIWFSWTTRLPRNLWQQCLLPSYGKLIKSYLINVLILFLMTTLCLFVFPHIWSYGRMTNESRWSVRTWWYEIKMTDVESDILNKTILNGNLQINWRGYFGEKVIIFYMASNTRDRLQGINSQLLLDLVKSFWAWRDSFARGARHSLVKSWLPCEALITLSWFLILGTIHPLSFIPPRRNDVGHPALLHVSDA